MSSEANFNIPLPKMPLQNVGDKQYIAAQESPGEYVVRLCEVIKQTRDVHIGRFISEATAKKVAKALNEAEGL